MSSKIRILLCCFVGVSFLLGVMCELQCSLGMFHVSVNPNNIPPSIMVTSANDPAKVVWETLADRPFLVLANSSSSRPPISDGNYQVDEVVLPLTDQLTVATALCGPLSFNISGELFLQAGGGATSSYRLDFAADGADPRLRFDVSLSGGPQLGVDAARTILSYHAAAGEAFFGFGESFAPLDLQGRRVPVLVSEQGVGRGEQPITDFLNAGTPGVGGAWFTTYAPKPLYLTSLNRSVALGGSAVSFFDLTRPGAVSVEVWDTAFGGWMLLADSLLELVEAVTSITGRQQPPPQWTQAGAVVGLEGGSANVTRIVASLQEHGVPLAGFCFVFVGGMHVAHRLWRRQGSGCRTGSACATPGTATASSGTGRSTTTTTQVRLARPVQLI